MWSTSSVEYLECGVLRVGSTSSVEYFELGVEGKLEVWSTSSVDRLRGGFQICICVERGG